jgi:cbb3-type cytochrome oxidase maturation protein
MDILYLLIPLSALLVLAIVGVFAWASFSGQFEGLEHEGERILASDDVAVDAGQAAADGTSQKSAGSNTASP